MAQESHDNGAYQMITPPNLLKAKVGTGGAGGIDPDLIKRAEGVVDGMADDFEESVTVEVARMMKLSLDLEMDPVKAAKICKKVRQIGHDLRGQGATYGYDLISDAAESLFDYTERLSDSSKLNADVIRAHADAMRAIIKNKVKGKGGKVGSDLVDSLLALVERMTG